MLIADGRKGATLSDALVVDLAAGAGDGGFLHGDAPVLLDKVDGSKHRKVGVAFATAGTTVEGYLFQCPGSHQVAEPPAVGGEGVVARDN